MVWHDETRHGLRRLCVMSAQKYPDLETWLAMLPAGADAKLYRYVEKEVNGIYSQFLWIYWKE